MSFSDVAQWNLDGLAAGAEALRERAAGVEQYGGAVRGAPALTTWAGAAAEQARALAAKHANSSDAIAAQARSLVAPLRDYLESGRTLKAEAADLVAEAAAHGFEIQSDGSAAPTRPQSGFYAKVVAKQLAARAAQIIEKDEQLQQSFASAVRAARGAAD